MTAGGPAAHAGRTGAAPIGRLASEIAALPTVSLGGSAEIVTGIETAGALSRSTISVSGPRGDPAGASSTNPPGSRR